MQLSRRAFLRTLFAGSAGLVLPPRRARGAQGSFDGGSSSIPPAVAGTLGRVIVIGAGMAGLAAADALRNAGVEVVVLEARDRLGGRTHSADLGGVAVDLGASWIHTPTGNPMSEAALLAGVALEPADATNLAALSGFDALTGWLSPADLGFPLIYTQAFASALPQLRDALPGAASVADAFGPFLDSIELEAGSDLRRRTAFALRLLAEQFESAPAEDLALAYYGDTAIEYDGTDVFPEGGYRRIVEWLAGGLDVRLAEPVTAIAADANGVTVTTELGEHAGSHAIVTLPLGVLKAGAVVFAPALPAARVAAIDAVGFGNFEKVALRYGEAFWLDAGRTNFAYLSATPMQFPYFFDLSSHVGTPALVAFASDGYAAGLRARSDGEIVAEVESILGTLFPGAPLGPTHARVTRWGSDPFTLGAYTYVALGATPGDLDALGEPHADRILFAGEHTSRTRFGYADGALATGVREAKRLLQQPAVLLPEPGALPLALAGALALWLARRRGEQPVG